MPTKDELKAELNAGGIEYKESASKDELQELVKKLPPKEDTTEGQEDTDEASEAKEDTTEGQEDTSEEIDINDQYVGKGLGTSTIISAHDHEINKRSYKKVGLADGTTQVLSKTDLESQIK